MKVVSVNVGRPQLVVKNGRPYSTAINRKPAAAPVELTVDGFVDDRVSDLRFHGGPDKAACIYPLDHYEYWHKQLGKELPIPSFGENLTTLGLLEDQVCIGDIFRIGRARVQVTQPRQPCSKLANKHDEPRLIKWINEKRWTGFYVRTLDPGVVAKDDIIELLERPYAQMSIERAMSILLDNHSLRRDLQEILGVEALSEAWRTEMEGRLRGTDGQLFE